MIGYIVGKVVAQINNQVIVKIPSGLGYMVYVGAREAYLQNENFEKFILQVDREDKVELYGFTTLDERKWVEKLLKVNGIGPKMAANIVHTLGVDGIQEGLMSKDPAKFGSVKGLGSKTAKKLLLEIKGDEVNVQDLENLDIPNSRTVSDFTETLANLGYRRSQVVGVIAQLKKDGVWDERDLKQMVKEGLRYFAK
jgi:holliday junction DNA helicase RuvA